MTKLVAYEKRRAVGVITIDNPPSEIKLSTGTVAAVHKVLTMNELFAM